MSYLTHLQCSLCHKPYPADQLIRWCPTCEQPLLAPYDLAHAAATLDRDEMAHRPNTLWRYHEMLPVQDPCYRISLGEGGTPVLKLNNLGQFFGLNQLYLKDEGQNPTGSFKALGLAVAVSRALELGAREFVIPTAGNACGALAAYCARAGVMSHVFMPQDAPLINILEVQLIGADLRLVNGLINDAGREAAAEGGPKGWFLRLAVLVVSRHFKLSKCPPFGFIEISSGDQLEIFAGQLCTNIREKTLALKYVFL